MELDEEMFRKRLCLDILIFLFLSNAAVYAADLVVPSIKAPYSINDAQFDNTGDYFAYEVNGKVYIRDSLSLFLKDSYASNSKSKVSPFYTYPDRVDYPKVKVTNSGNSVTVQTQKSAASQISTFTLNNLPGTVKAASVNKAQTYLGFITEDGNTYVYDLQSGTQKLKLAGNSASSGIAFTKDSKVIISDSAKTVGMYDLSGQKVKTYTTANPVSTLNLSLDEETLVISDTNGTLNFYNTNSTTQIGYVPNFGSKNIKSVQLSKDSRRILITGENNTLYIAPVQEVLFAQNTVAPTPKQFAINYNQFDPNDRGTTGITEFGTKEYVTQMDDVDAEYITSTQEKGLGTQNFKLEEERKAGETVIITQQPEQAYFPPSEIIKDREADFSNKKDEFIENEVLVQEFKQPKDYTTQNQFVDNNRQLETSKVTETKTPLNKSPALENGNGGNGNGTTNAELNKYNSDGTVQSEQLDRNITINIFGDTGKKAEEEKVEEPVKVEEKKEEKEEEVKEEKEKVKKEKKTIDKEELKTYFKDGHGLLVNVGACNMEDPYTFGFSFITGYLNYDLIQPFYLGGLTTFSLGIPKHDYPYKYANSSGTLNNPYLVNIFITAPLGFTIYPWKSSVEFYVEIDPGVALYKLWNGGIGGNSIAGKFYPVYRQSAKIGAAWDFINLSLCANYDPMMGFTFEVHLGALINIGGSRTLGSLIQGTKK